MSPLPKKTRTYLATSIKLTLVGAFLYLLASKGLISVEKTREAFGHPEYVIPAVLVLTLGNCASAIRWQILLRAQGIRLAWGRMIQLHLVGLFFNFLIPGAVSGDLVKAFYVGKEFKGMRAQAFGSILFDRIVGLAALIVLSATALLIHLRELGGTPLLSAIQAFMGIAATLVIAFFTYLFLVREHHDPLLIFLRKMEVRYSHRTVFSSVTRIYEGVRHYHHHRSAVALVLLLSLAIHLSVGWACMNFAHALGELHLSLNSLYVVVPIGLVLTSVPVAPAGVGTGHAAFLTLFHLIGSERGADVFSLMVISNLLTGLIGGLVYLQFKAHNPDIGMALAGTPEKA